MSKKKVIELTSYNGRVILTKSDSILPIPLYNVYRMNVDGKVIEGKRRLTDFSMACVEFIKMSHRLLGFKY